MGGGKERMEGEKKGGGVGGAVRGVFDSLGNLAKWSNYS
jgi:hypothetical protein